MADMVRLEICFSHAANNELGYLPREDYNAFVEAWDKRGKKPPQGTSRYSLFNFRKQLEAEPVPTLRIELDNVVKIKPLSPVPERKTIRMSEKQRSKRG